jgi:hypothetical protein
MLGEGELTRAEAQIVRGRASARLERAEAEIAGATAVSALTGLACRRPGPGCGLGPGAIWAAAAPCLMP